MSRHLRSVGSATLEAASYEPIDLTEELPSGTTVLEASAGTGKPYTIAGLVTRYVAEGRARIDQVLAVTFGVAATSELRTRVRERLVAVRDALSAGGTDGHDNPVVRHLGSGTAAEVADRRDRLAAALADFDAATVATVHEFCQQVLTSLGVAADTDPHVQLVDSLDDVVDNVVADLYLRHVTSVPEGEPALTLGLARQLAEVATSDRRPSCSPTWPRWSRAPRPPCAVATLRPCGPRSPAARGRRAWSVSTTCSCGCATRSPTRCSARWRGAAALAVPAGARRRVPGHRPGAVGGAAPRLPRPPTLVLTGTRSGDLRELPRRRHHYLDAARHADARANSPLGHNFRSDPALLQGLQRVFRGAALGDDAIVVREVEAGHATPAVQPAPDAPVRLRLLGREGHPTNKSGLLATPLARSLVAADVAAEVARTLAAGLTHTPRGGEPRPLEARDVAVLVPTRVTAELVRDALRAVGVASVFTGTTSVFGSEAAADWVTLLQGLDHGAWPAWSIPSPSSRRPDKQGGRG